MNKPLVAFFAALCIFGYGVALSAPINQGSVKGDKADAWAVTQNGRTQYFWADVGGDGAPDAFFAMHGVRYRRVEIDLDQDGRADLVTLLDHKGEYRHFTDDDRDGLWQPVAPSSILEKSDTLAKSRALLLRAVEYRIHMDDHPKKWKTSEQAKLRHGFVQGEADRKIPLVLRLTKTPSQNIDDPQRSLKPLPLAEKTILAAPCLDSSWTSGPMQFSDDLMNEGKPSKSGKIDLHIFVLPTSSLQPGGQKKAGTLIQVAGAIEIEAEGRYTFCAIIDNAQTSPASVTVPAINQMGQKDGAVFIEAFFPAESGR